MAPMSTENLSSSNYYGEDASTAPKVDVLASCYIVDSTAHLKGIHYCTTGAAGAECPPLAALTPSNELALLPKTKKRDHVSQNDNRNPGRRNPERRGGAALMIREECERFFCESMKTAFHGERNLSMNGSGLAGAYLQTPPPDDHASAAFSNKQASDLVVKHGFEVNAWMEVWDYAGGASFRAFVSSDGQERSLFVFFDIEGVLGRDLKKALMALIELADGPLDCSHIVTCIDRRMPVEDAVELTKSLQWVGFDITTLDHWAADLDVTSNQWMFMGMEV